MLPFVTITGSRGSPVAFTVNDTSLYDYWQLAADRMPRERDTAPPPRETPPVVAPEAPVTPPKDIGPIIEQLPPAKETELENVTIRAPLESPFYAPQPSFADVVIAGAPKRAPAPRRAPPRRSKPKPKPVRRRPTTKPLPRIRIPVPAVLGKVVGRLFGLASLTPAYLAALAAVSDYGTRQMYERLYGVPLDDRDDSDSYQRPGNARENAPRSDRAVESGAQPYIDLGIPTVRIPGTRPGSVALPEYLPFPVSGPGVGNAPEPFFEPAPRNRPVEKPVDEPFPATFPEPFSPGVPSPGIVPAPAPVPSPAPAPEPFTPAVPLPGLNPIQLPGQGLQPFAPLAPDLQPQPFPQPSTAADPCNCGGKEQSKKKRKKKSSGRSVCYRGTYVEKQRGLTKRRRERVDCKSGKPLS